MYKAINIALILPDHIIALCTALNHLNPKNSAIRFTKEWPFPHICLWQYFLSEEEIQNTWKLIEKLTSKPILINDLSLHRFLSESSWSDITYLECNLSEIHKRLHLDIMNLTKKSHWRIWKKDYFYHHEVSKSGLDYLHHYSSKYAYDNYNPHIIIAKHHLSEDITIDSFSCSEIWIFHMWANWTCQHLLYSTYLW